MYGNHDHAVSTFQALFGVTTLLIFESPTETQNKNASPPLGIRLCVGFKNTYLELQNLFCEHLPIF